uniref:Uncharacterized protein n=1 Tax=Chrysotila carterae TaxID=13221 RepID=A0A7S4BLF7_CHRCT
MAEVAMAEVAMAEVAMATVAKVAVAMAAVITCALTSQHHPFLHATWLLATAATKCSHQKQSALAVLGLSQLIDAAPCDACILNSSNSFRNLRSIIKGHDIDKFRSNIDWITS